MTYDSILMVDWSGGNDRGPSPKKDAIWLCVARGGQVETPVYLRNRQVAESWIIDFLTQEQQAGRRVLAGFDFAFGFPAGFGAALIGSDDPLALWDWFEEHVQDSPKANNRFDLTGHINAQFPGIGPFWGNGLTRDIDHLPRKGSARTFDGIPERRLAEQQAKGAFPVWQLAGAGAVGSQTIMGLPVLARLRRRFGADLTVWPFEPTDAAITLVEVWPSLIADAVKATMPPGQIKDAHQVSLLARAVAAMKGDDLALMLQAPQTSEGWIMGLGHRDLLARAAMAMAPPPPLKNDCFAMPQGAHWTPVDQALAHLQSELACVTGTQLVPLDQTPGRFAAQDILALRAHPPAANAAVDGYGFAGPAPTGINALPLVTGRAAAGAPYDGTVPPGHAIRILTGANLPDGVDTVVLQEDVSASDDQITFHGPLKPGANARATGEDMNEGATILNAGRRITPGDIGMLAAAGIGQVNVHARLKVGVLSTGDELRPPGAAADIGQIYDSNRPMLTAVLRSWGYDAIDLGQAPDDRDALRAAMDEGAARCDAIISSGGASAGDADHMSALLQGTGSFALWRIAMKPGRPLALGLWGGKPVFGLPGNPVAAMVCTLVFCAPALRLMAGGGWSPPRGVTLPANFTKIKKPGRHEYLRARLVDGRVDIFASEGSGRVSGLAWATGLVVLGDAAQTIRPGDPVTYIPFADFG